ncbi:MAG TPA: dihydrolipoamide acetyltransferase family protein, partial [Candidatus Methylomirabilis sp.]|nr:dihydrolipoamide acetyltransferase family protein [Candidatus Methylomirabilis sp.]
AVSTVPVLTPIAILAGATEEIEDDIARVGAESRPVAGGESPSRDRIPDTGSKPSSVTSAAENASIPMAIRISPAARKSARAQGLDVSTIWPGSGPGGRILSTDVARAGRETSPPPDGQPVRRPMGGMRKAIARSLVASKQSIPHFYMRLTCDASPLESFSRARKAEYPCSINDVLIAACARVLHEFPAFRTRIENGEMVEYPAANIGLAVGMEDGLRVPVLIGADRMTLRQVADGTRRIVEAARQGKVEGMGRGVFTISNLGMYGVEEFAAIINPPEAALLAVGAVRESVIVKDGGMRAGRVITLTLSADHRVIDGLLAARFLNRLRELLEAPNMLGQ